MDLAPPSADESGYQPSDDRKNEHSKHVLGVTGASHREKLSAEKHALSDSHLDNAANWLIDHPCSWKAFTSIHVSPDFA